MSDPHIHPDHPSPSASPGASTSNQTASPSASKNYSRTPTSWDAEDDIMLMHLKDSQKLGWKEIASHFNNRTPNACQFRWRRLKSGNLKNPPKSAAALGTQLNPKPSGSSSSSASNSALKKPKKSASAPYKSESGTPSGFPAAYSPISNATFTGYDNNVSNALAGLNALSNTPSNISSPLPNYNTDPSTPGLNSPGINGHQSHLNHTTYDSPKSEVSLDPQSHNNAPGNTGGGYYADISIDPTMNLPHNLPHPHTPHSITPRNSTSHGSSSASAGNNVSSNHHHSNNNNNNNSSAPASTTQHPNLHNNSIIQIARDDRNSISSTRASVSSLPSKSMNIPHHQSNNNALAHLPILFGGGSSISGPSRNPSISGPGGIHHSTTVSSLRNGSSVGTGHGYYSRSGSVVIPYNAEKKEEEQPLKVEKKKSETKKTHTQAIKNKPSHKAASSTTPVFKIPWSMEEDELLINRRSRELSFAELSILLPQRTEGEIWSRIDYLEKLRNGHRASASRDRRRRQSSIGLDDVDDFYDVDDVIGGIGVSDDEEDDDDEDDDVLVDVDDAIQSRKRRKRRASSAVNPLAVGDSIRKKLR